MRGGGGGMISLPHQFNQEVGLPCSIGQGQARVVGANLAFRDGDEDS